MTGLRSLPVAWIVLLGSWAAVAQNRAPDPASGSDAKGSIAGTIVSAKTGDILKSASVTLIGNADSEGPASQPKTHESITGMDGRFAFLGLSRGAYHLIVSKSGYATDPIPGSSRSAMSMVLGPAEARDDIVIRLQPNAVVSGHVFDADGEPLIRARVYLLTRALGPGGARIWMIRGQATTDDLGEYRLHGIAAGKYVLVAQAPEESSALGAGHLEFSTSFYPGVPTLAQATPIKLANGAELEGIDFRLAHAPETVVSGSIVDVSNSKPCGECYLSVAQDQDIELGFHVPASNEGMFILTGMRPGKHRVTIYPGPASMPSSYAQEIEVPEAGEANVRLVIGNSHPIAGELVLESPPRKTTAGGNPAGDLQTYPSGFIDNVDADSGSVIAVVLEPVSAFQFPSGGQAFIPRSQPEFELPDVPPGDYRIQIQGIRDGYLRSVTIDGRELDTPHLKVTSSGPFSSLKLHVAFDGGTVRGTVKRRQGKPGEPLVVGEETVVAVPNESGTPFAGPRTGMIEADGSFLIKGLAPGSYTVYAVPSRDLAGEDPELQRVLEPFSKRLALQKNETANVELEMPPESLDLW